MCAQVEKLAAAESATARMTADLRTAQQEADRQTRLAEDNQAKLRSEADQLRTALDGARQSNASDKALVRTVPYGAPHLRSRGSTRTGIMRPLLPGGIAYSCTFSPRRLTSCEASSPQLSSAPPPPTPSCVPRRRQRNARAASAPRLKAS